MSCLNRLRSGAAFMIAGLLPLAGVQAHAQTTTTTLLSTTLVTLPGNTMKEETDSNNDLMGEFVLGETDPLGLQAVASLAPARSGFSAGWLVGGALGAAGLVGLAGGGGSGSGAALRTPATVPSTSPEPGATVTVIGSQTGVVSVGNSGGTASANGSTSGTGGSASPFGISGGSGGSIGAAAADTPEPGSLAMLGGMGLMLTAAKLRRRKR
jgi:hypothetical protein